MHNRNITTYMNASELNTVEECTCYWDLCTKKILFLSNHKPPGYTKALKSFQVKRNECEERMFDLGYVAPKA